MNSHATAIARKTASRPTLDLFNNEKIFGRVLDYGSGKGKDTEFLRSKNQLVFCWDDHHPSDSLNTINSRFYDTIICNYVINTVQDWYRKTIINHITSLLAIKGSAYITTRTAKEVDSIAYRSHWRKFEDGYLTKRGTFQKGYDSLDLYDYIDQLLSPKFEAYITEKKPYSQVQILRKK